MLRLRCILNYSKTVRYRGCFYARMTMFEILIEYFEQEDQEVPNQARFCNCPDFRSIPVIKVLVLFFYLNGNRLYSSGEFALRVRLPLRLVSW